MRCSKVKKLLPGYMDSELSADLAKEVKEHLELCEHCAAELKAQRQVWTMLDAWETPEPQRSYSDFVTKVNAEKTDTRQNRVTALLPVPAWAAAVLVLMSVTTGGIFGVNKAIPKKSAPTHEQVIAAMDLNSFNDVLDASLAIKKTSGSEKKGAE